MVLSAERRKDESGGRLKEAAPNLGAGSADLAAANDIEGASRPRTQQAGSSVYRAWAMPE